MASFRVLLEPWDGPSCRGRAPAVLAGRAGAITGSTRQQCVQVVDRAPDAPVLLNIPTSSFKTSAQRVRLPRALRAVVGEGDALAFACGRRHVLEAGAASLV